MDHLPPHPGHGWCAVGKHPALPDPVVTARVASLPPRSAALQDDMQLSPDFFTYFEAAAPILDADDSLMCVSSWNDHGQASSAAAGSDACCVVRSPA